MRFHKKRLKKHNKIILGHVEASYKPYYFAISLNHVTLKKSIKKCQKNFISFISGAE
jgi:hypothetical protein